jgi:hypothetical protein
VTAAVPDPSFRDQLAEAPEPAWVAAFYEWARTNRSPGSYSAAFAAGYRAALASPAPALLADALEADRG